MEDLAKAIESVVKLASLKGEYDQRMLEGKKLMNDAEAHVDERLRSMMEIKLDEAVERALGLASQYQIETCMEDMVRGLIARVDKAEERLGEHDKSRSDTEDILLYFDERLENLEKAVAKLLKEKEAKKPKEEKEHRAKYKLNTNTKPCQHCGQNFSVQGLWKHEQYCKEKGSETRVKE